MVEVLFSHFIARARKWSKTNGAYEVWRDRNPDILLHIQPVTLNNMRRKIEKKLSAKEKLHIQKQAEKEAKKATTVISTFLKGSTNQKEQTITTDDNLVNDASSVTTEHKDNLSQPALLPTYSLPSIVPDHDAAQPITHNHTQGTNNGPNNMSLVNEAGCANRLSSIITKRGRAASSSILPASRKTSVSPSKLQRSPTKGFPTTPTTVTQELYPSVPI